MTRFTSNGHPWLMTTLCAAALAAAACGSSPTSPSAAASVTSAGPFSGGPPTASASAAATQLRFAVDLTVPPFPVCPVSPSSAGVISGTGLLTVVLRAGADANGGTHLGATIHGHGTATDESGGEWIWNDADLNNELFPSGNTSPNSFAQTVHEGFHLIGPNGQQIKVLGTFHVTTVNGLTVVEVEHGNHEDAEICESGFVLTPLP